MNIQREKLKFSFFNVIKPLKLLTLLTLVILMLSSGCATQQKYYKEVILMDKYDYKAAQIIKTLRGEGVIVLYELPAKKDGGVTVHLFAKGAQFFDYDSTNFNNSAYPILEQIELLLQCYEVEMMEIRGGVAADGNANASDCNRVRALAKARAYKIAQYLRSREADVNFMYVPDQILPKDHIHMTFVKYKI